MTKLLEAAGASFLRAFGVSLIVLSAGVLAAPNLNQAYALGVAALASSLVAGLRALQVFVPQLSFKTIFGDLAGAYVDSFARAFIGTALTLSVGFLNTPDLEFSKAAVIGIVVGAGSAGARAVQGLFTKGEFPLPNVGAGPAK